MNLLSLTTLTLFSLLFFSVTYQSKDSTFISNPILRLSSRRKRTLLLPNYGSIKVTIGISKGLIGNNPKGLSLSYEMCSYYAGPTVIKDLLNDIQQKKPKREDFQLNKTKNLSIYQKYLNLSHTYFSKFGERSYKQTPLNAINLSHSSNNMQRLFERSSSSGDYISSGIIDIQRKNPLKVALDYLLGPDAGCGVLRKICRSKEFLLPPGYSMIQDIVRIIVLALEKDLTSAGEKLDFCGSKLYADCHA